MDLKAEIKIFEKFKQFGSVKNRDLVIFTRELATLSRAGLPLIKCLMSLRDQMKDGKFKVVLSQVVEGVERGDSFSESLARQGRVFPKLYINMIRSGEASGDLDEILKRLATLLEKQQRLRKKVQTALVYPAFVLTIALLILSLLMIFVVPTFTKMFADMGGELPKATQVLIMISKIFQNYWYLLLGGLFLLIYGLKYSLQYPNIRYYGDKIILNLPIFGKLANRVAISRFARTLGTLLNSGVPILNALNIVKETATNLVFARCVPSIIDSVKEGEGFAKMLESSGIFPNLVVKMVAVGEETGQLSDMLVQVADNYEEDIDLLIASLSSLMEPVLIVFMGVVVGFIVVAMFLPLFSITEML